MEPTDSSMVRPMRGEITRLNRKIAAPTARMVRVWQSPHMAPIMAEWRTLRSRLTIVETAATWSASVAWRMPRKNPRARIAARLMAEFCKNAVDKVNKGIAEVSITELSGFRFGWRSWLVARIALGT